MLSKESAALLPLLPSLPYPALTSHNSCCFSELVHALGKSVAVMEGPLVMVRVEKGMEALLHT